MPRARQHRGRESRFATKFCATSRITLSGPPPNCELFARCVHTRSRVDTHGISIIFIGRICIVAHSYSARIVTKVDVADATMRALSADGIYSVTPISDHYSSWRLSFSLSPRPRADNGQEKVSRQEDCSPFACAH